MRQIEVTFVTGKEDVSHFEKDLFYFTIRVTVLKK